MNIRETEYPDNCVKCDTNLVGKYKRYKIIYCAKCGRSGELNHEYGKSGTNLGRKFTEEHKQKISNAFKGRKKDFKEINCIQCSKKFKPSSSISKWCYDCYFWRTHKKCKDCGKVAKISTPNQSHGDYCLSCNVKGSRNRMYGKLGTQKSGKCKKIPYADICNNEKLLENKRDIIFRSSWEANFALLLNDNDINWEYERQTFELIYSTYTPDFYLKDYDLFVEVKGYASEEFYEKYNMWLSKYNKKSVILKLEQFEEFIKNLITTQP